VLRTICPTTNESLELVERFIHTSSPAFCSPALRMFLSQLTLKK
jgi:hypothetical protein